MIDVFSRFRLTSDVDRYSLLVHYCAVGFKEHLAHINKFTRLFIIILIDLPGIIR